MRAGTTKRLWPGVALAALLQSGCVMYHQTQPEVEGRLLNDAGQPVSGAEVTLDGSGAPATTHSDSDGFFAFPDAHEWTFFLPIGPADWVYHSILRIAVEGRQYETELGYGLGGPHALEGETYHVLCTLPAAAPSSSGPVICQPALLSEIKKPGR